MTEKDEIYTRILLIFVDFSSIKCTRHNCAIVSNAEALQMHTGKTVDGIAEIAESHRQPYCLALIKDMMNDLMEILRNTAAFLNVSDDLAEMKRAVGEAAVKLVHIKIMVAASNAIIKKCKREDPIYCKKINSLFGGDIPDGSAVSNPFTFLGPVELKTDKNAMRIAQLFDCLVTLRKLFSKKHIPADFRKEILKAYGAEGLTKFREYSEIFRQGNPMDVVHEQRSIRLTFYALIDEFEEVRIKCIRDNTFEYLDNLADSIICVHLMCKPLIAKINAGIQAVHALLSAAFPLMPEEDIDSLLTSEKFKLQKCIGCYFSKPKYFL